MPISGNTKYGVSGAFLQAELDHVPIPDDTYPLIKNFLTHGADIDVELYIGGDLRRAADLVKESSTVEQVRELEHFLNLPRKTKPEDS